MGEAELLDLLAVHQGLVAEVEAVEPLDVRELHQVRPHCDMLGDGQNGVASLTDATTDVGVADQSDPRAPLLCWPDYAIGTPGLP